MSAQSQVIYRSVGLDDFPPPKTTSIADFLFSPHHAPLDDSIAFTDAVTGTRLTRAEVYDLSLRLAKGVDTDIERPLCPFPLRQTFTAESCGSEGKFSCE